MSDTRLLLSSFAIAVALSFSPAASCQDAKALEQQAQAAFKAKHLAEAGRLYAAAAEIAGSGKSDDLYNAACAYALAGQTDKAFGYLQASIDAGGDGASLAGDSDLDSLHADARWAPLLAGYAAAHPESAALDVMQDMKTSEARRYAAARAAVTRGASLAERDSTFGRMYASQAQFVGEYDEASRVYGWNQKDDVVAAGFTHAVEAVPVVLAQARGRQAVFLNESHGQSQTRAANYALLAGLRKEGFEVLAMEGLSSMAPAPRDATHCSDTSLGDPGLPARGYAVFDSGFYSRDPVYAEMIREALRLGFQLVAYDTSIPGGTPEREQNQAENLSCVFKENPKARLVVIAGFGHIAEGKDFGAPGGMMAYRFRQLTGIDPLTVETTTQLYLDPAKLTFAAAGQAANPVSLVIEDAQPATPVSFVLEDAQGAPYHTDNSDLVLYVPAAAHRNDGKPSWLGLGRSRKSTPVDVPACRGITPCVIQARRVGERTDAIAADACVPAAPATGCNLFLRPGDYEVTAEGADAVVAHVPVTVDKF